MKKVNKYHHITFKTRFIQQLKREIAEAASNTDKGTHIRMEVLETKQIVIETQEQKNKATVMNECYGNGNGKNNNHNTNHKTHRHNRTTKN